CRSARLYSPRAGPVCSLHASRPASRRREIRKSRRSNRCRQHCAAAHAGGDSR
ncbi:MAG: hypothetical protein AVDCRST_MAG71-2499, partial [uncultured Lysobacter sp.]